MVHPGFAVALLRAFCRIGASVTLIVAGTDPEFRWSVFGKVMKESLPEQAHPEAAIHDEKLMLGNGFKVLPWLHAGLPLFLK